MVDRGADDRETVGAGAARDHDDGAYFAVEFDREGTDLRVVARGELDAASAARLAAVFHREGRPDRGLSLDLGDLTFIDSSGIRAIATEVRRYDEAGTRFEITAASEPVRRIFEMTGLGGLLGGG